MSHYRYPRENHKCGLSAIGQHCERGPVRGLCGRGPDTGDLPPCRPIRTFRWWSQAIRIVLSVGALIVVGIAWSNTGRIVLLAPGPLSSAHAQLLVASHSESSTTHTIDANNRCVACHPGWDRTSGNAAPIASNNEDTTQQTQLCLRCHAKEMPDAIHGSPHDLTGISLQELVERGNTIATKTFLASLVTRKPLAWEYESTQCSQCHREHQGSMHTLQSMASDKCQACHRNQFSSFSNGHPEFKDYPHSANRNIAFDHGRHRDMHFTKKNAEFYCSSCHLQNEEVGSVGKIIRSVSFEKSCASCHSQPIKSAIQDGLIVLQLPSIDKRSLAEHGVDIGLWPEQSSQLNDGLIPPIMRWIMEAEPLGTEILSKLPASGRLADIDMNQPVQREALVALVQTTKYLIKKLANTGQPGFRALVQQFVNSRAQRQAENVGGSIDDRWLDRFASGIPPDLFRAAYVEWFGDASPRSIASEQSAVENPSRVHLSSQIRSPDDELLTGGDDLLATPGDDSWLSGTKDTRNEEPTANASSESSTLGSSGAGFQDARAWDQLSYGGWMIDRQRMAIVYVPVGHADPWVSRWVEWIRWQGVPEPLKKVEIGDLGIVSNQCTTCHMLHSKGFGDAPTQVPHSSWLVSFQHANQSIPRGTAADTHAPDERCWKSMNRSSNATPITRFNHTPHLTLPQTNDCMACHQMKESRFDSSPEYLARQSSQSDFLPISRAQCANCHQPNGASESCTQCHNYHVGEKSWHH